MMSLKNIALVSLIAFTILLATTVVVNGLAAPNNSALQSNREDTEYSSEECLYHDHDEHHHGHWFGERYQQSETDGSEYHPCH